MSSHSHGVIFQWPQATVYHMPVSDLSDSDPNQAVDFKIPMGKSFFYIGDPAESVYLIVSGMVDVKVSTRNAMD